MPFVHIRNLCVALTLASLFCLHQVNIFSPSKFVLVIPTLKIPSFVLCGVLAGQRFQVLIIRSNAQQYLHKSKINKAKL